VEHGEGLHTGVDIPAPMVDGSHLLTVRCGQDVATDGWNVEPLLLAFSARSRTGEGDLKEDHVVRVAVRVVHAHHPYRSTLAIAAAHMAQNAAPANPNMRPTSEGKLAKLKRRAVLPWASAP
jgi:hypothetical protein